ncbi:hypothetical protein Hanom_Chr07g00590001 [Helianthus anomalus]
MPFEPFVQQPAVWPDRVASDRTAEPGLGGQTGDEENNDAKSDLRRKRVGDEGRW